MDNKMSELSKPVAYTDADELRFNHATSDMWPIPLGFGKDAPLYSQEYVSALLAELEAKDKHIADMERVVAAAKCDDELWDAMAHRLKTMEDKLATPVRLPEGTGWASDPYNHGRNSGINECASAIRAAGFTVEDNE